MWKGPGQDPGGGQDSGPPPGPSQELSELKDQVDQQQVLIAQLKELIRKNEQTNVTQENVDEYMNTLSKRGSRAKKLKKDDDTNKKTIDIPASQKITLLRQQVEENKARLAERGKSQKGIEEMVTQLKAQLDDSQQLISQSPLNLSLQDSKEYSENSSSQELYLVLLTKEKRVSDLMGKVQKLEANVLDLQENVREKDSVIDARTKALTLMTENLSRKGKNTLDALDETKEQMRKMQENFVSLETDMKARQMKLLDDLRQKNYEIAELQDTNASLVKQIEEGKQFEDKEELEILRVENAKLTETLSEKDVKIKDLEDKIAQMHEKESEDVENEEIAKLKKQLEESNKNMIKVKAQHKSKVKELTKKIDAFKKISDVNAEFVKLESENSRLSQKIAEIEEEKGSLQLKLVESDSAKGSETAERRNELEEKIQDLERQLEERDKVISILEGEISRSKTEIESLSEKLTSLSHLENAQVSSEMASIQFEEQMESLENEKKKLTIENENAAKEKDQLIETIELLKKEKQEISTKLEHYIQENMELIDKLEKLSAEKVSSAESIEIVEGLTQQEKLELEAYQKNLDMVAENLKCSEENLPQVDLNESVNELTEETSELLQKIELFTVERREVMDKMEQLKQENVNLGLKVKEIENNRDVLAETYEQLQSEKEALDVKLEAVEAENASLKEKSEPKAENLGPVKELEEEIENYKSLLEEKRLNWENLNSFVEDLKSQLEEMSRENVQLNNTVVDLNRTLADLDNDNKSLQMKISYLEQENNNLNELLSKKQEEIEVVSNTEWETRRLLESKDNEITKLTKERDNTDSVILDLQKTIKDKDDSFHKITSELKTKYLTLQKQLEDNSGSLQNVIVPLESKIEELTSKNKEQLEKMKKIAANLKKKTQAYQDLEDKMKEAQNRHEIELKTSLQQLQDLEIEVARLHQQFDDKCEETAVLEEKNVELQNIITDLKARADKSKEVSLEQELLLTRENLGTVESSLQSKIQELEMIIETQESELVKTRERVNKLEEGISFVEERRMSLERKANELGAQLEEKEITCEEMSRSEDLLERRLVALAAHDEAIEKKLEEADSENQELAKQNQTLSEKNDKLKKKLVEFKEKIASMENQQNIVEELEAQNETLKKQVHNLENEIKILQLDYEKMLEENKSDFDKMNGDWQAQFDDVLGERAELLIKCERFGEELKEITEKELGFNSELIEYKTKLEASEQEIKSYEEQILKLSKDAEEVNLLRQEVAENADTIKKWRDNEEMKNQEIKQMLAEKEDAVKDLEQLKQVIEDKENAIRSREEKIEALFLEGQKFYSEIESLKKTLVERESEAETYRKQTGANTLASFFGDVPKEDPNLRLQQEVVASRNRIEELERTIANLQGQKSTVASFFDNVPREDPNLQLQQEVSASRNRIEELERTIEDLQSHKIASLQPVAAFFDVPKEDPSLVSHLQEELVASKARIQELENIIDNLQVQKSAISESVASFFDGVPREDPNLQLEQELIASRSRIEELEKIIEDLQASFFETVPREDPNRVKQLEEEVTASKTRIEELEKIVEDLQTQKSVTSFFDSVPREDPNLQEIVNSKTRIEELEKIIEDLRAQKSTVFEPQVQKNIPTFVWSGQTNDPFDFIESAKASTQEGAPLLEVSRGVENTNQELLDKIKTLEFMLFNTEREKEETLMQCQQLTNEITRLIYEKQMPAVSSNVESQILQPEDIKDTPDSSKQLQMIEFEETRPPLVSSFESGPIVEEMIKPEEAYVCYSDKNQPQLSNIESQVLSQVDIADTAETRRELQNLEFESSRPPVSSVDQPIKEEPCGSKEAYLCYNTFGENDDGWGWGPDEAKLEEEHAQKENYAQKENFEDLQNRIRVLEMERENHVEEIRQLQVKSGKLIKKLKEMKVKNEELAQRKKSESDLFSLDDTIQEELKLQIQQVEKKLKETATELEKEKNEKIAIMKRVDVLTSANERMVEMKEKQDIELLGWQQNCRELNAKVERLEWGDEGFSSVEQRSPQKEATKTKEENLEILSQKIEELNDTIKELTLDNEELQALLEEQRRLRLEAEKSAVHHDLNDEKKQIEKERDSIGVQLNLSVEEKRHLQDQVNELIRNNGEMGVKIEDLEKEIEELEALKVNKDELIYQLNEKLKIIEKEREDFVFQLHQKDLEIDSMKQYLEKEKESFLQQLRDKVTEIESLRSSVDARVAIEGEKDNLLKVLEEKNAQLDSLRLKLDLQISLENEKEILFKELQEKNAQINTLQESVDTQLTTLRQELDQQIKTSETLLEENKLLSETVSTKDTEIVRLTAAMEQMTQEWDMRIDQRGADVAESWKLHVEARESEFAQIEQLLRKEIYELEEKTNALVNENNELRKNVDAEIRNEVDRVAALQQQINDRQQAINELTRTLQERQEEVKKLHLEVEAVNKSLDEEKKIVDAVFIVLQEYSQDVYRSKESMVNVLEEKEENVVKLRRELDEIKESLVGLQEDCSRKSEEIRSLRAVLEERNQMMTTLNLEVQDMRNLKDYEHENIENLQQTLSEYQQINGNISAQLQMKIAQLEDKDREVATLKLALEEKERQHVYTSETISQELRASISDQSQEIETLKRRLVENENHYEELLQIKDSELEGVRFELATISNAIITKSTEFEDVSSRLEAKIEECATLQRKIDEQSFLMDEENKQLTELRAIIEEQVLKIEELKTELFHKSNDYDSLIAEVDISNTSVKEGGARPKVEENEDLSEPVSRAELDLALYMLHQRDVRCEELTVELTQLLEERDTLQLRLSNVIREKEELMKVKEGDREEKVEVPSSSGAVPKIKTEFAVEALDPLSTKLSELKTVGYKKDKTIVDEQELRRFQQLSIMQQHRDAASKLPPEAAARLVDASYTLSRDVQSPSKVLLNWLWGRSTPKVNNI